MIKRIASIDHWWPLWPHVVKHGGRCHSIQRLPRPALAPGTAPMPGTRSRDNVSSFLICFLQFWLQMFSLCWIRSHGVCHSSNTELCSILTDFVRFWHWALSLIWCRRLALLLWLSSATLRCLARAFLWPREMAVELKGEPSGEDIVTRFTRYH